MFGHSEPQTLPGLSFKIRPKAGWPFSVKTNRNAPIDPMAPDPNDPPTPRAVLGEMASTLLVFWGIALLLHRLADALMG